MHIVNLTKFLQLPAGTVYSKYQPCVFEGIEIKGENCGGCDFFIDSTISPPPVDSISSEDCLDILDKALLTGDSFALDFDSGSRDGCFNTEQLFAIWDPLDIQLLITKLQSVHHT